MTQPPEPTEKPSLSDQIADVVLKVVMAGGLPAGGIGAFWLLIQESDVPKALLSLGIGGGLSYGAKLLQPIHAGNQRRLENTGKAIDQGIDRLGEAAIAKMTSKGDRYLACQAADCETCATEGMAKISGIFTPMLEDVYVPLEMDRNSLSLGWRQLGTDSPDQMPNDIDDFTKVDIWRLLARTQRDPIYRQIAILAWGGYGKTTLLRHIAYTLGKKQQPSDMPPLFPVLLLLRKYRDLFTQSDDPFGQTQTIPNLPTLIETRHIPDLPDSDGLQMPTDWAKNLLKQGKMLVMIDGFDEVPKGNRPLVAQWLNEQMRNYRKSVFMLTSRPKAYTEQDPADRLDFNTLLHVRNFNDKQRKDFVEKWYWCQEYYHHGKTDTPGIRKTAKDAATDLLNQITLRPSLAELTTNPLLLNMVAMFHRRYPGAELPKRRTELYQEMCVLQLRDRPGARGIETLLTDSDNAQIVLQMLALEMMQQKEERVEQEVLLTRLAQYLMQQDETVTAKEFLTEVEQVSELLVQRESEEYEFAHLSFQEYLAAREVVRLRQESLLYEHFEEDWWKSVMLFYVAQVKRPSSLIREALDRGAKDLAYVLSKETSKQIDADLVDLMQQKDAKNTHIDLTEVISLLQMTWKDISEKPAWGELGSRLLDLEELIAFQSASELAKDLRYQKLEELLKAQQWKEADEETYRLMITAVGKEEGQWFTGEDLLNFPCEDLRVIDGLWVKYSKGLFGFSVQQKIYRDCGVNLENDLAVNKDWDKFGDRVGWRKDGDWLSYHQLNPSFSSPMGMFPTGSASIQIDRRSGDGTLKFGYESRFSFPSDYKMPRNHWLYMLSYEIRVRVFFVSSLAQRFVTCSTSYP